MNFSYQLIFGFHPMDGIPEDAVHGAQTLIQAYCLCIRTNFPSTDLRFPPYGRDPGGCRIIRAQTLMQALLPVHPHEFLHQLIFGLPHGRIPMMQSMGDADAGRLLIVARRIQVQRSGSIS